jgi:hypothetical protein
MSGETTRPGESAVLLCRMTRSLVNGLLAKVSWAVTSLMTSGNWPCARAAMLQNCLHYWRAVHFATAHEAANLTRVIHTANHVSTNAPRLRQKLPRSEGLAQFCDSSHTSFAKRSTWHGSWIQRASYQMKRAGRAQHQTVAVAEVGSVFVTALLLG